MHLEALGDHLILLNSLEVANELLEKRSRIYSSRPYAEAGKMFVLYDIHTEAY